MSLRRWRLLVLVPALVALRIRISYSQSEPGTAGGPGPGAPPAGGPPPDAGTTPPAADANAPAAPPATDTSSSPATLPSVDANAPATPPAADAGPPDATAGPADDDSDDDLLDGLSDDDADDAADDDSVDNPGPVTTGAFRFGVYGDSDQTTVIRSLVQAVSNWEEWSLSGSADVDAVTSASTDVRTSPALGKVDVITGASGRTSTSGGHMRDNRFEATGGVHYHNSDGYKASLSASAAAETDYDSLRGGVSGSLDLWDRAITVLGGVSFTQNWIQSVLDPTLHKTMYNLGWSAGVAWVFTPNDALRLRYDGSDSEGYQASPYRNVRFGNWTTRDGLNGQVMFENTIGSADGLPETVPSSRIGHALVIELVHSLAEGVGLHPSLRLGHDSWGLNSLTAALDLRVSQPSWRMQLGYRFYKQSAADFFQGQYTMAPSHYTYYTSAKELGNETGHAVTLDLAKVLRRSKKGGQTRLLFDARATVMYYDYPGFLLLHSRLGAFVSLGLTWEQ